MSKRPTARKRRRLRNIIVTWMGLLFVLIGFATFVIVTLLLNYDRTTGVVLIADDHPVRDIVIMAEERTGAKLIDLPTSTPDLDSLTFEEAAPYPPMVAANINAIYATGQAQGNRPDVFSKVGDSITVAPHFLKPIGDGLYNLGDYEHLEAAVFYFSRTRARDGNSFYNDTLAGGIGWAAWGLLDPSFADPTLCNPGESPLACEYRIVKPSIALIMIGTNDVTYRTEAQFETDLNRIVTLSAEAGVIPVLSTIPPLPQEGDRVDRFNAIVTAVSEERYTPLMDYHSVMVDLPNNGLSTDEIHPSVPPGGYFQAVDFDNELEYGYVARNLVALEALYRVWAHLETQDMRSE